MKAKVMNAMQSFSKALMGPVLFLPIAGMLQALSSVMCNTAFVSEGGILYTAGKFINGGVSAVIGNLGILFCVGVSMSLAKKKKADAAFVSLVSYLIWLSSLLPKKRKKAATKAQVIPATLTASLVGVTEPLEFTFLFAAPMLWVIYSVMDGLFQMIVYLLNVRVCATNGIIDFLVLNLPAGIGRTHWPMYVVAGLIEIVVMYFLFRFLIVKFNLKTPGREDGEDVIDLAANAAAVKSQIRSGNKAEAKKEADAETAARIIEGLGGPDNIENIGNCMTRLRVEVKDASVVKDKEWFAPTGAAGLVVKGNNIQIIYGPVISKKRSIVEKALGREE